MGNLQNKENINLANELDYIAANYIINNTEELDLTKDKECEKLVEKISDLLRKESPSLLQFDPREQNHSFLVLMNSLQSINLWVYLMQALSLLARYSPLFSFSPLD